jgi:hypothetical protein
MVEHHWRYGGCGNRGKKRKLSVTGFIVVLRNTGVFRIETDTPGRKLSRRNYVHG